MNIKQNIKGGQQVNELRLKNTELKKELEREQFLHKMLYKDWEKLTGQISAQRQEVNEKVRPKNLFYKYAFYVLLIGLLPAVYFLYPLTDNSKSSSSPSVSDGLPTADSAQSRSATTVSNSHHRDSTSTLRNIPIHDRAVTQQLPPEQPVLPPAEKKAIKHDNAKPALLVKHKPVIEAPLTEDDRDSISSLGFNAYFDHHRNPFRRASDKYKAWEQGWNEGKAEAKKLLEKDPTLK